MIHHESICSSVNPSALDFGLGLRVDGAVVGVEGRSREGSDISGVGGNMSEANESGGAEGRVGVVVLGLGGGVEAGGWGSCCRSSSTSSRIRWREVAASASSSCSFV